MGILSKFLNRKKDIDYEPEFFTEVEYDENVQKVMEKSDEILNSILYETKNVLTGESVDVSTVGDVEHFIKTACERIVDARNEVQTSKVEHAVVSEYLNDIEIIVDLSQDVRNKIDDTARAIVNINNDRENFQSSVRKLTNNQLRRIEIYEEEYPDIVTKLKEKEEYQGMIKNDMYLLEGEKASLEFNKKEIERNQKKLHKLTIGLTIFLSLELILLATLSFAYEYDMLIPSMLTVVIAAVFVSMVFFIKRSLVVDQRKTNNMLNKVIRLLNKVKIKCINNTTELDYLYDKHGVHNAHQLEHLWSLYMKAKDEEKRYNRTTADLEYYSQKLIKQLKAAQVKDTGVWPHQAIALIDKNEMEKVKYSLVKRKQKLRERVDYNKKNRDDQLLRLQQFMDKHKEHKKRVLNALVLYNITVK